MDISVNFKSGGSFVTYRPQFSRSGENVYITWKNYILGYNTKTGQRISEFKGIKNNIVGFSLHYHNNYECITACSKTGEIITWKAVTYFKLLNKKINLGRINTFCIIPTEDGETKALISYIMDDQISFCIYNLDTDKRLHSNLTFNKTKYYLDYCSDKYFTVATMRQIYFIQFQNMKSKYYEQTLGSKRRFTCLACHPTEEVVLTGDSTGRVVAWQNLFGNKQTQAVFHWHTLPVNCVAFSTVGTHFFSGADECVLVRWQLDNPMEKKFLPRIPANIKQITVSNNNLFIAVATNDNAIRIIDSRFDPISLIQHLVIGDQFESGIIYDPRTRALVMNGNVGHIQFYSPSDGNLLYNVDIVFQNKITNERNCKIENTQIRKVAISKSGLWMATVEGRHDLEYTPELRLKFWQFDLKVQTFKLNTSIEYPHKETVESILFQPSNTDDNLKCVTVGSDKTFKVWQIMDSTTIYKKGMSWSCLNTGFYRQLPCKASAFSTDGSLLAINFNEIITTWQPDTCDLKCSLVHPNFKEPLNHLQFGRNNECHLLVAASERRLSVWNLLTLTMLWTVEIQTDFLIVDSITTNMAVITVDKQIIVFSPAWPKPIYESKTLLEKFKKIQAATFMPSKYSNDVGLKWYQRCPIYFLSSDRELFSIGNKDDDITDTHLEFNEDHSLFDLINPKSKTSTVEVSGPTHHVYPKDLGQKSIKKYLEAPIQTMIPIRLICGSLLRSMVLQKS